MDYPSDFYLTTDGKLGSLATTQTLLLKLAANCSLVYQGGEFFWDTARKWRPAERETGREAI
jgi:hypothetical protein